MDSPTIIIGQELFAAAESSSFAGTYALEKLAVGPDTYTFSQPVRWNVLVTNTGGALLVSGTVEGTGETECARCLELLQIDLCGQIEAYFLLNAEDAELEEGEEDEFEILGPDNTIDMVPLLEAALIMELPLQPLCQENCQGLCPDCGINLNQESCNCAEARAQANAEFEAAKNPFAKLKELDFE